MQSTYNKLLDMKHLMLYLKSFLFIGYNSCIKNVSTEVFYKWLLWLCAQCFPSDFSFSTFVMLQSTAKTILDTKLLCV